MAKSKKKVTKKAAKATKKGYESKSAFVRAQPKTMPASEVAALAKKAGFTIAEKYVYVIRSNAKKAKVKVKALKSAVKAEAEKALTAKTPAAKKTLTNGAGTKDQAFRKLVLELGVSKAEGLISEVRGIVE